MKRHRNLVLAIASKGGHWEQLMLLRPAFEGQLMVFGTTDGALPLREGLNSSVVLPDGHRDSPWRALQCAFAALKLVLRERPRIVLSTGALPGLLCILAGRTIGAKTIWIDSFANSERLSMSGHYARYIAHAVYSQWEHVAAQAKVQYAGSVL